MTELGTLRWRLDVLRHARAGIRRLTATLRCLAAVLTVLLFAMLLDVLVLERLFRQLSLPRVAVIAMGAVALSWILWRCVLPLVRPRESMVEMALLIERRLGVTSDLVAALQFDHPGGEARRTRRLEQAVIEQAARRTGDLRVGPEIPFHRVARSAGWLLVAAIPWVAATLLAPEYVSVFFNRLSLGSRHYPTRTQVQQLLINEHDVPPFSLTNASARGAGAAAGEPVTFSVLCSGHLPRQGRLTLRSDRTGAHRTLVLRPTKDVPLDGSEHDGAVRYEARLDRLLEPLSYCVEIGDAWTEPRPLSVIPKPLVKLTWQAQPPSYARLERRPPADPDAPNPMVLEGTRMTLRVTSVNSKRLQSAWMWVRRGADRERIDLRPVDDSRLHWALPETETPFGRIVEELQYELQVRDEDGLLLESPVRGSLRMRADQMPFATAGVVHRVVLPTANPVVEYRLLDDYGIGSAELRIEIERASQAAKPTTDDSSPDDSSRDDSSPDDSSPIEVATISVLSDDLPLLSDRLPLAGRFAVDLARYSLAKGDRLKLSLQVTDYRGERAGESFVADPLILAVSDERAVLDEISEADAKAEARLTEIIERQLGIEETP